MTKHWETIPWFGAFKIECGECHRHITGWSEKKVYETFFAESINNIDCLTCLNIHLVNQVVNQASDLLAQKLEIQSLKASILEWKEAWHVQRAATGKVAWEIPLVCKQVLIDALTALGQCDHANFRCPMCRERITLSDVMLINVNVRADLISNGWKSLDENHR